MHISYNKESSHKKREFIEKRSKKGDKSENDNFANSLKKGTTFSLLSFSVAFRFLKFVHVVITIIIISLSFLVR